MSYFLDHLVCLLLDYFLCLRQTQCGRRHNGFVLFVRPCVRPCVRFETLLTGYLADYLTYFHQTCINDAVWDRDKCLTIWVQKVKGQGHGGIKYAGNNTFWFVSTIS